MRTFAKENGLGLFFLGIFLAALVGQSFAGQHAYNAEQQAHGENSISWWSYVLTPYFWLVQKGSNESKRLET